ncbi:MAG: formylglycine-generating enzyme family protein [Alphaproteobacteria bacterium]|nr:formylglycine-generating enzyme family protein [Alphaproteobacteria bacterium]
MNKFYSILVPLLIFTFCHSYADDKAAKKKEPCGCGKVSKASALISAPKIAQIGMVEIPSGSFMMGNNDPAAKPDESPVHQVKIDAFYMDETEVTNEQFQKFVKETSYVTTAEKPVDWELLKQQIPPNTPKPSADKLAPGSLVFKQTKHPVSLNDYSQWWHWINGADWRHPHGPKSKILGNDHPVVHVSFEDAQAYCKWQGKRLPTEAEREWAAKGGLENNKYPWGNEEVDVTKPQANIWEGEFPHKSNKIDWTTPVKKYPPNGYGLYDMAGNVWEWTSDLYDAHYYVTLDKQGSVVNPHNTEKSFDPDDPNVKKYVIRGGSFMCHNSYCWGYRISARMKTSPDSSMINLGFRCVKDK